MTDEINTTNMKRFFSKFALLILGAVCSLSAHSQDLSMYKNLNGTYVKQGPDYTIEAVINFNGIPKEGMYIDNSDSCVEYTKYYGYVQLKSGEHSEGYDIVTVTPAGDGPIFGLASWQIPRIMWVYPSFDGNTLILDSGNMGEGGYLTETLKKKVATPSASSNKDLITKVYNTFVFAIDMDNNALAHPEKYFTARALKKLSDAYDFDCYDEPCYAYNALRTMQQDSKPGTDEASKIISIIKGKYGWYTVSYKDMGWPGKTLIRIVDGKIDDFRRVSK